MTFEAEHASSIVTYIALAALAIALVSTCFHKLGRLAWIYPAGLLLYGGLIFFLALKLAQEPFEIANLGCYGVFIGGPLILASAAYFARKYKLLITSNFYVLLALLTVAIAIDAFLIEPNWLETTYYHIETSKLSKPLIIAVVSDIQMDKVSDYDRRILQEVADQKPDLILMPGDYVQCLRDNERNQAIAKFREIILSTGFKAPLGTYAVRGNCEWQHVWPEIFKDLPVTPLNETKTIDVGPLYVTGLSFEDSFNPKYKTAPKDKFHIIFGHGPDFALAYPPADLLIAGHTHGGQVRLPGLGPVITLCRVPRAWAAGITQIAPAATLVVSRGLGMERRYAPRLRFLCRPQLIFITLVPRAQAKTN